MTQIDETFLTDAGLQNLPDDQKQKIIEQLQTELEERVGEKLAANMSDEQLSELDKMASENEDMVIEWLEANRPDYQDVVAETANEMKEELAHNRDVLSGGA